jgi:hypothetical protein
VTLDKLTVSKTSPNLHWLLNALVFTERIIHGIIILPRKKELEIDLEGGTDT